MESTEKKQSNQARMSEENNRIAAEIHKRKQQNYDNFFSNFDKEYKLIKKITHECQYKCYNTEKSTAKDAENCARICLRPYMMLREGNAQKLDNCEQNFKFNESKCLSNAKNSQALTECYRLVVNQHDECLKTVIPIFQKNYHETIKDFDQFSKNEM